MLGTTKVIPGQTQTSRHKSPEYTRADYREIAHGISLGFMMVSGVASFLGIMKASDATVSIQELRAQTPAEVATARHERIEGGLITLGGLTVMLVSGVVAGHTNSNPEAPAPESSAEAAGAPPELVEV